LLGVIIRLPFLLFFVNIYEKVKGLFLAYFGWKVKDDRALVIIFTNNWLFYIDVSL